MNQYHHLTPQQHQSSSSYVKQQVYNTLKLQKSQRATTTKPSDAQGLSSYDPAVYENQHKHQGHKQQFKGFHEPLVTVKTQKESQARPRNIVDGVELSIEQLSQFHKGDLASK